MREKIIAYITEHPGCRKREIAYGLQIWQCNGTFLHTMSELSLNNVIRYETYHDPAQMEYYDKWYINN